MRAVGLGARDQFRMAVEQQRRAVRLDQDAQRLDPRDQLALLAIGKPQQHGRDIGGIERGGEIVRDRARIAERRGHQIEARALPPRSHAHGVRMRPLFGGMAAIAASPHSFLQKG